eukprot:2884210-Pyramimonas_sp.AAC.1
MSDIPPASEKALKALKEHGAPSSPRPYGPWGKGNVNRVAVRVTCRDDVVSVTPDGRVCGLCQRDGRSIWVESLAEAIRPLQE